MIKRYCDLCGEETKDEGNIGLSPLVITLPMGMKTVRVSVKVEAGVGDYKTLVDLCEGCLWKVLEEEKEKRASN